MKRALLGSTTLASVVVFFFWGWYGIANLICGAAALFVFGAILAIIVLIIFILGALLWERFRRIWRSGPMRADAIKYKEGALSGTELRDPSEEIGYDSKKLEELLELASRQRDNYKSETLILARAWRAYLATQKRG